MNLGVENGCLSQPISPQPFNPAMGPARVSSKKLAVGKSTGLGQRVTYLMLAGLSLANVTWMTWAHLSGMERFEMASRFKAPMMHRCGCITMSMQHCSNMLWIHLQNKWTPQILILSQIFMLSHKPTYNVKKNDRACVCIVIAMSTSGTPTTIQNTKLDWRRSPKNAVQPNVNLCKAKGQKYKLKCGLATGQNERSRCNIWLILLLLWWWWTEGLLQGRPALGHGFWKKCLAG